MENRRKANIISMIIIGLGFVGISLVIQGSPFAQSKLYTHLWHDGNVEQHITLVPDIMAEFPFRDSTKKSGISIRSLDAKAGIISENGKIRIWRLTSSKLINDLKRGIVPAGAEDAYSPVFQDSSGRKRALPGNVIVFMDKSWSKARVEDWARVRSLIILKQISTYSNVFLIRTPAGIESLTLANSLYKTEGVVSAIPNWWVEVRTR